MAIVVYDVALYTKDHFYDWGQCEWRKHLNSLTNIKYKDLNYNGGDIQSVVDSLNTWTDVIHEPLTIDSFPFVIYRQIDTQNTSESNLIIHTNLNDLKNDSAINNFNPNI